MILGPREVKNETAVFSSSFAENSKGYINYLLGLSPFLNKLSEESDIYINYIKYFLSLHNLNLPNIHTHIADSCNTKKRIAKKCKIPFVGCFSNRYYLAMKHFLEHEEYLISGVSELMKKRKEP